jgi:hypothetical protein
MRENRGVWRGGEMGGGGCISCVYRQPVRPASDAVGFSWSSLYEAKAKLEGLKNLTKPLIPSLFSIHRGIREADWPREQKATILVSIYSYRPYIHVVTNNCFIDLQTERMPGAVACCLSLSLSLTVCCFSYCYSGGSGVVIRCHFSEVKNWTLVYWTSHWIFIQETQARATKGNVTLVWWILRCEGQDSVRINTIGNANRYKNSL